VVLLSRGAEGSTPGTKGVLIDPRERDANVLPHPAKKELFHHERTRAEKKRPLFHLTERGTPGGKTRGAFHCVQAFRCLEAHMGGKRTNVTELHGNRTGRYLEVSCVFRCDDMERTRNQCEVDKRPVFREQSKKK